MWSSNLFLGKHSNKIPCLGKQTNRPVYTQTNVKTENNQATHNSLHRTQADNKPNWIIWSKKKRAFIYKKTYLHAHSSKGIENQLFSQQFVSIINFYCAVMIEVRTELPVVEHTLYCRGRFVCSCGG